MTSLKQKPKRPLVFKPHRRVTIPAELYYPFWVQSGENPELAAQLIVDIIKSHINGVLNPEYYERRGVSLAPLLVSESQPVSSTVPKDYPHDWFT